MIQILSTHHCPRQHRSAATFLRCRYRGAEVLGSGQLALFLRCTDPLRIMLCRRLDQLHSLDAEYRVFGCGPDCTRHHDLRAIDFDSEPPWHVPRTSDTELELQ